MQLDVDRFFGDVIIRRNAFGKRVFYLDIMLTRAVERGVALRVVYIADDKRPCAARDLSAAVYRVCLRAGKVCGVLRFTHGIYI